VTNAPDLDIAEALLPLSFSLHSDPGVYAVLAGAGVSRGAVAVAWQVFTNLIVKTARIYHEDIEPEQAEDWYRNKFSSEPTYETVLEKLGRTPAERQAILRDTFEPEGQLPEPTPGHRSVAQLMKNGAIRIVITLNFDRLFEQALREEGVEPVIVATEDQAAAIGPLHNVRHCIIHLHGEYQDAASLRNTVDELAAYPPKLRALTEQIAREYGLIIAGWSAEYDPALRQIVHEHSPHRHTAVWIDPAPPKAKAAETLRLLDGVLVQTTANEAFGHLADAVESLTARRARNPMTLPIAIETAKRALSGGHTAIDLHDRLHAEFQRLHALDDLTRTDGSPEDYQLLVGRLEEASAVAAALVAVLAYWGTKDTDRWWTAEIERFARTTRASGGRPFLHARRLIGTRLLYAAGTGALAANRYDTFTALARLTTPNLSNDKQDLVLDVLSAGNAYQDVDAAPERRHRESLYPVLAEALALTHDGVEAAWQHFEILRLTAVLLAHPDFDTRFTEYTSRKKKRDDLMSVIESAQRDPTQKPRAEVAYSQLPSVQEDADKAFNNLRRVDVGTPHIHMTETRVDNQDQWTNSLIERLQRDLEADADQHPLIQTGVTKTSNKLLTALQAIHTALGHQAGKCSRGSFRPGTWRSPDELWLDLPIEEQ